MTFDSGFDGFPGITRLSVGSSSKALSRVGTVFVKRTLVGDSFGTLPRLSHLSFLV